MIQLSLCLNVAPAVLPCPCAASDPPGVADTLPGGHALACGLECAPVQLYTVSAGPCFACHGRGAPCVTCGDTGSVGVVLRAGAWRRCLRGHQWRPADAARGRRAA